MGALSPLSIPAFRHIRAAQRPAPPLTSLFGAPGS